MLDVSKNQAQVPEITEKYIIATEENFDEKEYLTENPDVAAAVAAGAIGSGYDHFQRHGRAEGRILRREHREYISRQGLSTPLPPSDLVALVVGHRDREAFDVSRRASVDAMIASLTSAGIDHTAFRSILDFGCGCGRVLAGWEGQLQSGTALFGCDLNARLVEFCQSNVKFAEIVACSYYPPLPSDRPQSGRARRRT